MHRQAGVRLWPSVCRLHVVRTNANFSCRVFSAQTGEPKATPALLDKIKDKDLLKVHGFIGGQWVPASDGTTMEVITVYLLVSLMSNLGLSNASRSARPCQQVQVKNPATGEVIATVPCMKANETSAAVAEATSAWPEWSKKVAKERSKIMRKYALCTDSCNVLLAA